MGNHRTIINMINIHFLSRQFSSGRPIGRPFGRDSRPEVTKIIIKNLDKSVNENHLNFLLTNFGSMTSCKVARDHVGNHKGYAIVAFSEERSADRAISHMNGLTYCGRQLAAERCRPRIQQTNNPMVAMVCVLP